jgi:hypothetical protein
VEKIGGRKFTLAAFAMLVLIANDIFSLGITQETKDLILYPAMAGIFGIAIVDAAAAIRGKKK